MQGAIGIAICWNGFNVVTFEGGWKIKWLYNSQNVFLWFLKVWRVTDGIKVIPVGEARIPYKHSGGRGRGISEFEASLVYKVSSRTARAIQRNPSLEWKKNALKKIWTHLWQSKHLDSFECDPYRILGLFMHIWQF